MRAPSVPTSPNTLRRPVFSIPGSGDTPGGPGAACFLAVGPEGGFTEQEFRAGVGAAVLGKPLGPRRAAVLGGILGTLPDLDVFFPFDDPVESFVLHRGATHSLIVHAVVTPLIAEPLVRFVKSLKG